MTIDSGTIAAYDASRKGLADKPFKSACYAPYTSLYFNTNGDVIACCKNTTYVLGNVATQSLEEIWRGKKANAMRKALRDYKFGVGCEFCEWQVKGGQYDQVYATIFDDLPVNGAEAEWPARMEFTVSNTCNLACVMCYGVLSSTIRAHREKLPPLPKVYDDRFFTDLRKFLPHLKDAKFFGGEPFLAQENYRIWDMMIEDGIIIPCHVTTNGTQWNKKVERVLEAFPCSISISLDGATKETVESVRVNANFEEVRANVEKFLAYSRARKTHLSLTFCLMRQNWHEFGEYLRYGEERGVRVFINTVIDPVLSSLYTLPTSELESIAKRMDEMNAREGYSRLPKNGAVWTSAVQALHKNADEQQRSRIAEIKQANAAKNPIPTAWTQVSQGKFEEALRTVSEIEPTEQRYYMRLLLEGHALRRLGRIEDAEKALAAAIALNRRGPSAFTERAWLHLDQRRFQESLADAENAVKNLDGYKDTSVIASAYLVLGRAHANLGNFEAAILAAERAAEITPDDARMHTQRGWIFWHAKRYADAAMACDRALSLKPDNAEALKLRGMLPVPKD